jgi:hypothetical protein
VDPSSGAAGVNVTVAPAAVNLPAVAGEKVTVAAVTAASDGTCVKVTEMVLLTPTPVAPSAGLVALTSKAGLSAAGGPLFFEQASAPQHSKQTDKRMRVPIMMAMRPPRSRHELARV